MFRGIFRSFRVLLITGNITGLMKVISVKQLEGGADVVAIKTKGGWYKTKAGMSHNCDDL